MRLILEELILSPQNLQELKNYDRGRNMLEIGCLKKYDDGGEYLDGKFKEYCIANDIKLEKNIPKT